jgi:Nif-specific regulatory protein
MLADYFISQMNVKYNKNISRLSPAAINLLMSYQWPGNVRELSNCIERAVLTAQGNCIQADNLPTSLQSAGDMFGVHGGGPSSGNTLATLVKNYERELVTTALRRNDGNISAMGRELGLSPRMACYKLKTLDIKFDKKQF